MNWHLTWQDPVALALAVAGIALALWLRRRFDGGHDCGSCSKTQTPPGPDAEGGGRGGVTQVSLGSLRMGRRPGAGPHGTNQGA